MIKEELSHYIKDRQSKTLIIMKCEGKVDPISLPDEVRTFKTKNQVIMAGESDIILDWLDCNIEHIDSYTIEYNSREEEIHINRQLDLSSYDINSVHINTSKKQTILGNDTIIKQNCIVGPNAVIGENCIIKEGCIIGWPINGAESITIGNKVVVEENVIVLNGVSIGNNVIISKGSIVTEDVSDHSTVSGVPASSNNINKSENVNTKD